MANRFTPTASVKLVIWDLDDTLWTGTLSEGDITLSDANIGIVRTLVDRGIMASIVSKNDFEPVKRELMKANIWDLFIFPHVSWNPKGVQIAEIIEQTNLRPDNVLFVDDNPINLEEVRFCFPTMMVGHPDDVLPDLLAWKETTGKDDREHSRLKQYQQLEQKVVDQTHSPLSNVEFLRQCDIRVWYDFNVDAHMSRIIELINRSNQLNFTKKRVDTAQSLAEFRSQLQQHDIFAAAVFASDRYGEYGLIGFYLQQRTERANRLIHYVWSCRMMNAGLEQYVYTQLGRPDIDIVEPVSNPIEVFDTVDWILEGKRDNVASTETAARLLLLGSCDLTAVSSYCSPNREEYVNGVNGEVMTRYDDFGFILNDPSAVQESVILPQLPVWSKDDFVAFRSGLVTSDLVILSLSAALKGVYLLTNDGVVARVHPEGLGHQIDFDPKTYYLDGTTRHLLTREQHLTLLGQALAAIQARSKPGSKKFLLGANTRDPAGTLPLEELAIRRAYNEACSIHCRRNTGWHFVPVDELVTPDKLIDDRHYNRMGYLDLANYILRENSRNELVKPEPMRKEETFSIAEFVGRAPRISRFHKVGAADGRFLTQVKQAVKMSPVASLARRMMAPLF